jgi:hypothetical protein
MHCALNRHLVKDLAEESQGAGQHTVHTAVMATHTSHTMEIRGLYKDVGLYDVTYVFAYTYNFCSKCVLLSGEYVARRAKKCI